MGWFGIVFASLGAGMVLFALLFLNGLLFGLVNSMVALMSGPVIDKFLARRKR
jgi:hypothetical protein